MNYHKLCGWRQQQIYGLAVLEFRSRTWVVGCVTSVRGQESVFLPFLASPGLAHSLAHGLASLQFLLLSSLSSLFPWLWFSCPLLIRILQNPDIRISLGPHRRPRIIWKEALMESHLQVSCLARLRSHIPRTKMWASLGDESEGGEWKSWLKAQHSENEDHGIWSHHFMGNSGKCQTLFWGAPKSLQMVIAAMKLKDTYSLEGKLWPT